MTFKYKNVYVKETSIVAGPYEKKGPLKKYYDKTYDDLYFGENSWEKAFTVDKKYYCFTTANEINEKIQQAIVWNLF